jgi:hypothetical protein
MARRLVSGAGAAAQAAEAHPRTTAKVRKSFFIENNPAQQEQS